MREKGGDGGFTIGAGAWLLSPRCLAGLRGPQRKGATGAELLQEIWATHIARLWLVPNSCHYRFPEALSRIFSTQVQWGRRAATMGRRTAPPNAKRDADINRDEYRCCRRRRHAKDPELKHFNSSYQ